jgi:hypothetical protein
MVMSRFIGLLVAGTLVFGTLSIASAQSDQRCFPETGQCITGRIRTFWEQNGGLPVFGFPIGPQHEESIEGKPFQVQSFERNRLELHPESPAPYDVLLGRLGVDSLVAHGRDWFTFPKGVAQPGCRFFVETGHNICGDILTAWHASGLELDGRAGKTEAENLALFGLPLSDLYTETLGDGKQYQVQWFERARFEQHPENQPPYNVLLGLLGDEIRDAGAAQVQPTAQPTAQPQPQPTTPSQGGITLVQEPGTVSAGSYASVTIHTTPQITCSITVLYKNGPSKAAGLYDQQADANGLITWSWKVGTNTTPGTWPVMIQCGDQTTQTSVTVS